MNINIEVKVEEEDTFCGDTFGSNKENDDLYKNHIFKEDVTVGLEAFHRPLFTDISTKDANHDFNVEVKVEKDYNPTKDITDIPKKIKAENQVHSDTLVCPLCRKVFTWKNNLARHMKVHDSGKKFTCHLCHKKFIAKWNLTQHLRIHNNLKYQCQICGRYITDHSRYNRHVREHKIPTVKKKRTMKLICDVCGKSYLDRRNLVRHVQAHYEENRYKCHLCTKSYTRSDKLKKHVQSHLVEKPYSCVACGRRFLKLLTAKRHEKSCHGLNI